MPSAVADDGCGEEVAVVAEGNVNGIQLEWTSLQVHQIARFGMVVCAEAAVDAAVVAVVMVVVVVAVRQNTSVVGAAGDDEEVAEGGRSPGHLVVGCYPFRW